MTLLAKIEELLRLDKAAEPDWFKGDAGNIFCKKSPERYPILMPYGINASAPEIDLAVALRNAAPTILAALDFRPGDAEIINDLLEDWVYSETHPAVAVLERWLGMARKMEKEEKR